VAQESDASGQFLISISTIEEKSSIKPDIFLDRNRFFLYSHCIKIIKRCPNIKYKCKICNYIYDPEKGDSDAGIKPGTAFEDLPDDWICPAAGWIRRSMRRFK
jgi:rubredoxin